MGMATTNPYDDDHLHDECAVFGIYGTQDAAAHTALGLHALQHRGQEAAKIANKTLYRDPGRPFPFQERVRRREAERNQKQTDV